MTLENYQRNAGASLHNRSMVLLRGLAAVALLAAGVSANAQDSTNRDGDVSVGGEHILTVRFPAGGLSVKQRADKVTERLNSILSDPSLKPKDIYAVALGKNPATATAAKIMVKNTLLVTVDAQTAKYNSTKAFTLAQSWVAHLQQVLPKVNVKPNPNLENGGDNAAGK